jgi:FtsH-binding integral membrane protein
MATAAHEAHRQEAASPGALQAVWLVVNAVNLLQGAGFATRGIDPGINHVLGLGIMALAVPAGWALTAFVRVRAGWRHVAGPAVFIGFVAFSIAVDYWLDVEFRSPRDPAILAPYLGLFFGSILLMGLPMYRIDRRRWAVTAMTTAFLLGTMLWAMSQGMG